MIQFLNGSYYKKYFLISVLFIGLWSCKKSSSAHQIVQKENRIEIQNSKVKAVFLKEREAISQVFYAKKNDQWHEVASAFIPPTVYPDSAVQLFNQDLVAYRYLSNSLLTDLSVAVNDQQTTVTTYRFQRQCTCSAVNFTT